MRLTRQGPVPPPGGAVLEQMRERLPVLELRPLVRTQLQIGEHVAVDVQPEREMSTLARLSKAMQRMRAPSCMRRLTTASL